MTLPRYMLRRFSAPGGTRLEKLSEPVEVAGTCPLCSKVVVKSKINSMLQVMGIYSRGEYYHYQCAPKYEPVYTKTAGVVAAPKGNLGSEEYRFWIGYRESYSDFAMCRACRTSIYTEKGRVQHFADPKYVVGGNPCSTRLVNAYKNMLIASQSCIMCKKNRFSHQKWGVPICEQTSCQTDWKFSQVKCLALELELDRQRKLAVPAGSVVQLSDDKPMMRPWCHYCRMFEDNASHAEIHELRAKYN